MLNYIFPKAGDVVWNFIQGINWLHPTIASLCTLSKNTHSKNENLDKSSLWIYKRYVMTKTIHPYPVNKYNIINTNFKTLW